LSKLRVLRHARNVIKHVVDSSVIKVLHLIVILYPLNPIHLIPALTSSLVYLRWREWIKILIVIVVSLPALVRNIYVVYVLLIIYTSILVLAYRAELKHLVLPSLIFIPFLVLTIHQGIDSVMSFTHALTMWIRGNGNYLVPVYTILAINTILITTLNILYKRFNIKSKTLPEISIPILLFMFLLVSAAVVLAIGDESKANKLAELAYYSLVIGVALQLYDVARGSK